MSMSGMDHGEKMNDTTPANAGPKGDAGHEMKPPNPSSEHSSHGASGPMNTTPNEPVNHSPDSHGTGNQAIPDETKKRLSDPGSGLGGSDRKVLVYTDLKALEKFYDTRQPSRELELHATGHMERFIWSFDGKKFSQAKEPIYFKFGERLRWTFVNDTMMDHTFHLHGMWMHLENGAGEFLPRKHTVIVKPAERLSVAITPDERGPWAFHCHLVLHMEAGMFRVVRVVDTIPEVSS